jgi:hypothetical protein
MPSSDVIASDRLEKLLRGAPPEGEREARLEGLVRELRANAAPAPQTVRDRMRALREPVPRLWPRITLRSAALALAPAVAVAVAGVGAATFILGGGEQAREQALEKPVVDRGSAVGVEPGGPSSVQEVGSQTRDALKPAPAQAQFEAYGPGLLEKNTATTRLSGAPALTPGVGRARDVDMWIELRITDADRLSEAANAAMQATRELGGFVASSSVGTQGEEGRAQLRLRVPVGRVEDALLRLSQLGTITGQRVATNDLQTEIDGRSRRIARLGFAIRIAELKLRSGTLDAEERLELQIKLERWRGQLADLRSSRARFRREAATAELTLLLHTRAAPVAAEKDESRVEGAARDALDFLGRAGSVALFVTIVLSPVVLLALLLWLVLRNRTRRIEERLLERPRPAAPSPQPPPS